jgi:type II restriction enzyme
MNKDFNILISTMRESIKTYDYFVNWQKVKINVKKIKTELNILNTLIGTTNFDIDFKELVNKYPEVIQTIPYLLATRDKELNIIRNYKVLDLSYDFYKFETNANFDESKLLNLIKSTGLIDLFYDKTIKNFEDYVYGVEVGLDSNGRKNRSGHIMENLLEVFIKKQLDPKEIDYISQATINKVKEKWGISIKINKSSRKFDVAIVNKKKNKVFLIETNFFNGGGSKLKSVCGEFRTLERELIAQNIDLIWVTDGKGWETARKPLEEVFNDNKYVFNLNMIEKGILKEIVG